MEVGATTMPSTTQKPLGMRWLANWAPLLQKGVHVRNRVKLFKAIYCYACDDDVKDENLGDHLAKLGIDVKRQVKTEQTITELVLLLLKCLELASQPQPPTVKGH